MAKTEQEAGTEVEARPAFTWWSAEGWLRMTNEVAACIAEHPGQKLRVELDHATGLVRVVSASEDGGGGGPFNYSQNCPPVCP